MNLVAGLTTKNEESIIQKTLSVLEKICDNIIVYDDGSVDRTEEICRSFKKVDWKVRSSHDPLLREEAKQRLELIEILRDYNPQYVLLLDADEIPTPSIVEYLQTENIPNLTGCSVINLWGDESQYRCDSYTTKFGTSVNWDPFSSKPWLKYPLLRFDASRKYEYDMHVQKGGCSKYHPSPNNPGDEVLLTNTFHLIHYGKISSDYLDGTRLEFYSSIEERDNRGTFAQRLDWNKEHNRNDTLQLKAVDPHWFWNIK